MNTYPNYIQGNPVLADTSDMVISNAYDSFPSCSGISMNAWSINNNGYVLFIMRAAHSLTYEKWPTDGITVSSESRIDDKFLPWTDDEHHDEKLYYNLRMLDEFSSYTEDWNLYGAKPISRTVIESVRNIIRGLYYQPIIRATSSGGIAFEYLEDNRDYLQFEFLVDGRVEMFFFSGDRKNSRQSYVKECEINGKVLDFKNGRR